MVSDKINRTTGDVKKNINNALQQFESGSLFDNAIRLFQTLGYNTERQNPLNAPTYVGLVNEYPMVTERMTADKARTTTWNQIHLLFQLTETEMNRQMGLFDAGRVNDTIIEAYLFFAIDLASLPNGKAYSRTVLSEMTRELNRAFPMPVMVLFKCGKTISLAVVKRRLHKRNADRDVLEKVTIIKDINIAEPHRAHTEILYDLSFPKLRADYGFRNFVELHNAWQKTLDSSEINKRFYRELSNWYFWALGEVRFPEEAMPRTDDVDKDRQSWHAQQVIRLLTRLIFVWFLKEKTADGKPLIPANLFDRDALDKLLNYTDKTGSTYYKAILQNLFFATLNTEMAKDKTGSRQFVKRQAGVQGFYRYGRFFRDEDRALNLFCDVPFLNGGLFENLDQYVGEPNVIRIDCFSDRNDQETRLVVPDKLFFHPNRKDEDLDVDLNEILGTTGKKYKARPLIDLLHKYKFTIDENTPVEEEIALDPELLGKVFENLLATYVPETSSTARKLTGSFYTPREIVDYMVDESLMAHLENRLTTGSNPLPAGGLRDRLRELLAYAPGDGGFSSADKQRLITALDDCKILDPACGSGAFPMGVLHKMVHILSKLDPNNQLWRQKQVDKVLELPDVSLHDALIDEIDKAFSDNELDYGRKLYLIENCLYGVDIQPVAVQITKLRCFIALIVDQRIHTERPNRGVRPLPNLELKFVVADSTRRIDAGGQRTLVNLNVEDEVQQLRAELKRVRDRYFTARTPQTKRNARQRDNEIRDRLAVCLAQYGFDQDDTKELAHWNPYDLNGKAKFFNTDWMFNLPDRSFDIVIANPPYIRHEKLADQKPTFKQQYPDVYAGAADLYVYFVRLGFRMLRPGGTLTYIMPNHWLRTGYGQGLRKFLKSKRLISLVNFGDLPVFSEATTYSCILTAQEAPATDDIRALLVDTLQFPNGLGTYLDQNLFAVPTDTLSDEDSWALDNAETLQLLRRARQAGLPLKQYLGGEAYRGVTTGLTDVFVPDDENVINELLSDPTSKAIMKPMLMGRDIKKYQTPEADRYLIFTRRGINIDRYPTVRDYLLKHKSRLMPKPKGWKGNWEGRKEGTYKWYEIQDAVDYYDIFDRPKIMYQKFQVTPCFIYDEQGLYCNDSMWVIPKNDKTLLAILNSRMGWFLIGKHCIQIQNGYQLLFKNLGKMPIANASPAQRAIIERYVNAVLAAKRHKIDTTLTEQLLDAMVFELYFPEDVKAAGCAVIDLAGGLTNSLPASDELVNLQKWLDRINDPREELRNRVIAQAHTVEPVRLIIKSMSKK